MQVTVQPAGILSRVAAVLLVGVVVCYFSMWLAELEAQDTAIMSHQELLAYLKAGYDPSFLSNYLLVLVLTGNYVLAVEGVAFLLRLCVRACQPTPNVVTETSLVP
jgi:hypothetical protein